MRLDDDFVMERAVPACAVLSIMLFTIAFSALLLACAYRIAIDGLNSQPPEEPASNVIHQTAAR